MANSGTILVNSEHRLNSHNPFVYDERVPLLQFIEQSETSVDLPDDYLVRALEIDKMLCLVKFICGTDIVLSSYYFLFNPFLGGILCIVSINGFMATIYYKRSLMCCYVGYQYAQVFARGLNLIIYISYLVNSKDESNTNSTVVSSTFNYTPGIAICLLSFIFGAQLYIANFIRRFYVLLPSATEKEQIRIARLSL